MQAVPGAELGLGKPLAQQAGSRQVAAWRGEPPFSPRFHPGIPLGCGWGAPQQPPTLTGGKTDGRGCVLSCGRPTHGHQLTETG